MRVIFRVRGQNIVFTTQAGWLGNPRNRKQEPRIELCPIPRRGATSPPPLAQTSKTLIIGCLGMFPNLATKGFGLT